MFWSCCCLSSLWLFVLLDFVAASSHFSFKLSRAFSRRFKSLMSLKYTIPADVCFRQTEIRDRLYLVGGNERNSRFVLLHEFVIISWGVRRTIWCAERSFISNNFTLKSKKKKKLISMSLLIYYNTVIYMFRIS